MPTLLNANYVYEMRVRAVLGTSNQEFENVFNYIYQSSTPAVPSTLTTADWMAAFRVKWRASFLPNMPESYFVTRYEGRLINGSVAVAGPPAHNKLTYTDFLVLNGDPVLDVGGRALPLDSLPPTISVSVERRVNLVGRRNFGVSRFGPVVEPDQSGGVLTNTAQTAWTAAVAWTGTPLALVGALPAVEQMNPVVFRKKSYLSVPPGTAPSGDAQQWDSVEVAFTLGTQMSRKQPLRRFGF